MEHLNRKYLKAPVVEFRFDSSMVVGSILSSNFTLEINKVHLSAYPSNHQTGSSNCLAMISN